MGRAAGATQGGWRGQHGLAAGLALGLLAIWALAVAAALHAVGTRPDRTGALLAVFPPAANESGILASVSRAQGSLVGATWLPNVWHVYGEAPGFAGALHEQGASLVLPPLPAAVFGNGACFGMSVSPPD